MADQTTPAPSIVVGTAGHVDHGKTELCRALTGINTDRLAEEQEREVSIDIGFAHLDLPDGTRVGIVDVPGHERFIKNMLAGATGIDLVMLIVAGDEGVMPQTTEHLDIVTLLGIETGIIVMTKVDLVDEEMLELAEEDIRESVAETPLANAPLVRTSAKTGEGLDELVALLAEIGPTVKPRDVRGPSRLPIDRVFSVTGFGMVATGTLVRGAFREGDDVEILPQGLSARVRGLQSHGVDAEEVTAAKRVAVNLQRVSGEGVGRGDTICAPGSMRPSGMLDVRLRLLARARSPLKQRTRIRIHHGTAEKLGRVYFMDRDALLPGESAIAQIRIEGVVAASRGDACVIRSYSPMFTIGGATVLDPNPRRHRRSESTIVTKLEALEDGDAADLAMQWIGDLQNPVFTIDELARELQLDRPDGAVLVEELVGTGEVIALQSGRHYSDSGAYDGLRNAVEEALTGYHDGRPLSPAMPKGELQARVGRPAAALLDDLLARMEESQRIVADPTGVRMRGHEVKLSTEQRRSLDAMVTLAKRGGFAPPTRVAVIEAARRRPGESESLLELSVASGDLEPVAEYVYWGETLLQAEKLISEFEAENGPFTIANLRDITGSSRKYIVPLAEYLDGTGFTRRQGDVRTTTRPPRG